MQRLSNDLYAVMAAAILSALLAVVMPSGSIVRLVFALPLVLFLPGYAITAALLPAGLPGKAERLLFSLGLSVVVTALSGLILNLTPWGLRTGAWAILLAVIVVLAGSVARKRGRTEVTISATLVARYFRLRLRDGLFLGLAILVTGAAVGLTRLPASPNGFTGYTQLWMTPSSPGNPSEFRLGLKSAEFTETRYRLQVRVGDQVVQEWPEVTLKPGETWETEIRLQGDQFGTGPIVADLYKLDNPATIYRHVKLWRGA